MNKADSVAGSTCLSHEYTIGMSPRSAAKMPSKGRCPMIPVGLDVSKKTLDLHYSRETAARFRLRVANGSDGFKQLDDWLMTFGAARQQLHVCLEATATYSDGVARFLHAQGYRVSLINPKRLAAFRESEGRLCKTDRTDAKLLARYCADKEPLAWTPPSATHQQIQVLVRRLDDLEKMQRQERNRQENQRLTAPIRQAIDEHIHWLSQRITQLKRVMAALIKADSTMKETFQLLCSITGIGEKTAWLLISELGDIRRFASARQVAAFVGVTPQQHESGTSVHKRGKMERMGSSQLRKTLYMCAMSACRHDPAMAAWAEQLQARGKAPKQILVAIMRKLLHIVTGVLTSHLPYDRGRAFPLWQGLVAASTAPSKKKAALRRSQMSA